MALSSDPHEQKLYHMFQSYASGDSKAVGLDREALLKLCFSLELKERGHLLVKCLFSGSKTHISFGEFRQGLLHILEGDLKDSLASSSTRNGSFSSDSSDRTSTYSRYAEDSDREQQQQQQHALETCSSGPEFEIVRDGNTSSNNSVGCSNTSGISSESCSPLLHQSTGGGRQRRPSSGGDVASNVDAVTGEQQEAKKESQQSAGAAKQANEKRIGFGTETTSANECGNRINGRSKQRTTNKNTNDETEDCSDREVLPKFVVGTKKYGRRSRPRLEDVNGGCESSSQSSNSDNESVNTMAQQGALLSPGQHNMLLTTGCSVITGTGTGTVATASSRVQRSVSQSDIHGSKRRRPMTYGSGNRLKRCASLPTHRQRPSNLTDSAALNSSALREQLHMDDKQIDKKIYFMNLSENLRAIWYSLLKESGERSQPGPDKLNQAQLEMVCESAGLLTDAARIAAQEVFSKLSRHALEGISFDEFIGLLESNTNILQIANNECDHPATQQQQQHPSDCSVLSDLSSTREDSKDFTLAIMPDWSSEIGSLAARIIVDMWESAGIAAPTALLHDLGFDDDVIQVADLVQALEEEHQRLINDHHRAANCGNSIADASHIVRASLALHKAEVNALRQAFHQLVEENKKLYADNKEVNHRAVLLAQEVDERQNSLETSTRNKIRQLKQRHHETMKELSSQLSYEREQMSHATGLLEQRIMSLETEETKLRADLSRLTNENEELRQEQENLTKEITELLEKNIKLNRDIAELEENNRSDYLGEEDDGCGGGSINSPLGRKDSEEVWDLIERISSLQKDNSGLRDKNDELVAEIEQLTLELTKLKVKRGNKTATVDDVTADVGASGCSDAAGDGIGVGVSATKRRGDSPSKTHIADDSSPRLGKFRKCNLENGNESDSSSGDWMALHSELGANIRGTTGVSSSGISSLNESSIESQVRNEELKMLRAKVEELEAQLAQTGKKEELVKLKEPAGTSAANEKGPATDAPEPTKDLKARCEELELSLEQMRKEYEDCEDYWQAKVNEERQLYEEEQRVSDEKLTELLKKMAEYEEQFALQSSGGNAGGRDGRLSPIDEKDGLEQQYLELEADFEQVQLAMEEKSQEAERLRQKIEELEEQMNKYPAMILSPAVNRNASPDQTDACSPISYLWKQSTIQRPVRDYQNPNWKPTPPAAAQVNCLSVPNEGASKKEAEYLQCHSAEEILSNDEQFDRVISPLQGHVAATAAIDSNSTISKQNMSSSHSNSSNSFTVSECFGGELSNERYQQELTNEKLSHAVVVDELNAPDTCSVKSFPYTYSSPKQPPMDDGGLQQTQQLRSVQLQLQDEIKELTQERDCLLMEVQQLKEAKPILARGFTKPDANTNYVKTIQCLEQKNKRLQSMVKQQQQYAESMLYQIWQQQRTEINDLRNRVEAQCIVISDQSARLASNDLLVKDMYEENTRLVSQVQRLEQQRVRAKWFQSANTNNPSSSSSSNSNHHGFSGLMPGYP
ncbi:blastoderm specific protein 25d [Anopheles darlingi]|uniref:Blastoderm specific protein 25d n=1 Tax=Anopheles darlingi TaxID=43151 RepID=W5J899_ANODA|nr:blastoderm specific protein 25d [Anopheles darlingi]